MRGEMQGSSVRGQGSGNVAGAPRVVSEGWGKLFVPRCSLFVLRNQQPTTNNQQPSCLSSLQPAASSLQPGRVRTAFTLTEILVVITILAILASLTTVGVLRALDTAKQTRIKVELDNLDAAFKAYKEKYGEYPPCHFETTYPQAMNALKAHIARAFPRYNINNLANDLKLTGVDLHKRPDHALVFWLRGFSPDPANPFVYLDPISKRTKQVSGGMVGADVTVTPFFEFDTSRLVAINNSSTFGTYPSYIPPGSKQNVPYVYFDSGNYGSLSPFQPELWDGQGTPIQGGSLAGYPVAYVEDVDGNNQYTPDVDKFVNSDTYQIIAPGLDGKYGSAANPAFRFYPTCTAGSSSTYSAADDDNVTNFCDKSRLGDAKP